MPRRRPSALRAEQVTTRGCECVPDQIHGISARTAYAIHLAEVSSRDEYLFPGVTKSALRRYRVFVSPPGKRSRYPKPAECPCRGCSIDDVRHARDVLESVLEQLQGRARSELGRQVARLDARYLARTLPDPFASHYDSSGPCPWWRCRLSLGLEGGQPW
jgi:hypothetical protein